MDAASVTSSRDGHLRQHMEETADALGRRGRWVYLALVVLSFAIMAVMFVAYADLWPIS